MAKFKKQAMIDRLIREGRYDEITQEAFEIMDMLDGKEASESCWRRIVCGEPVLWVAIDGVNGNGFYVNEADCE